MASDGQEPSEARSFMRDVTGYLVLVLAITTIGPFQFGFHLAELNAPQAAIVCRKGRSSSFDVEGLSQCIPMSEGTFSVISSIYAPGGLVGALGSGTCSTKLGRLVTMRTAAVLLIIGPVLESLANSVVVMSVGRVISGIGAGATIVVVPIYIAEVAPPQTKGLFGALTQIMISFGILIAQTLGYFLSRDKLWRLILASSGLISTIQIIGLLYTPESPKWLAENRHPQRARRILRSIRGQGLDIDAEVKAWNIDSSESDISEEEALLSAPARTHPTSNPDAAESSTVSIFSALTQPKYQPATIAVIAVMFAQQLTGINSIVKYSVTLLNSIVPTSATLLAVALSAFNLVSQIACSPLSDTLGRKTCILASIIGMGTCSILLALGVMFGVTPLSLVATLLFVFSFTVGLGPVPYTLSTELVGPEAVGATQSWALATNWTGTFLVAQFFPMLNSLLGKGKIYFLFAGIAAVFGTFIAWWVPETKGKSGIDEVWGRRKAETMEGE